MRKLVVVGAALVLAGCGGATRADFADEISALARSDGARIYYAGDAAAGLPLTYVDGQPPGSAVFVYGECNGEGEGENFHCRGPQVQIQNWTVGERHPSQFQLTPSRAAACSRATMRGVPVATFETTGGGIEVYAGQSVVVVFGPRELARRAVGALRTLHGGAAAGADLPRPPAHVVDALRRCAVHPPDAKLRELEKLASVPLYWVGRSFEGHPLARVEGDDRHARFVYGACALREDYDSGEGCWPPLEIDVDPVAERHPAQYSDAIKCRWSEERGALLATVPSAHTLQLFTAGQTVTLIGADLELLRRAFRDLRSLDRATTAEAALPRPPPDVRRTLEARCPRAR